MPRYMTIPQYCKYTGFTDKFIRRVIASGGFPAFKEGGCKWWINVAKADAYFDRASEPEKVTTPVVKVDMKNQKFEAKIARLKRLVLEGGKKE